MWISSSRMRGLCSCQLFVDAHSAVPCLWKLLNTGREEPNSGPWAQPFRGTYCYGFKSKAHKTSDFDHVSYSSDSSIQLFGGTHYNTNTIPIQLQSLLSGPVPCISRVNMSKCVKYHPKILKIVMCLKMWKSTQWQLYWWWWWCWCWCCWCRWCRWCWCSWWWYLYNYDQ